MFLDLLKLLYPMYVTIRNFLTNRLIGILQYNMYKDPSIHKSRRARREIPVRWLVIYTHVIAKLVNCQIEYLFTAGRHEAEVPNFLSKGCLVKSDSGEVEYSFGKNTHAEYIRAHLRITND